MKIFNFFKKSNFIYNIENSSFNIDQLPKIGFIVIEDFSKGLKFHSLKALKMSVLSCFEFQEAIRNKIQKLYFSEINGPHALVHWNIEQTIKDNILVSLTCIGDESISGKIKELFNQYSLFSIDIKDPNKNKSIYPNSNIRLQHAVDMTSSNMRSDLILTIWSGYELSKKRINELLDIYINYYNIKKNQINIKFNVKGFKLSKGNRWNYLKP
ncbi:MAG: hypothetical protein V1779_07645 [bacterium]